MKTIRYILIKSNCNVQVICTDFSFYFNHKNGSIFNKIVFSKNKNTEYCHIMQQVMKEVMYIICTFNCIIRTGSYIHIAQRKKYYREILSMDRNIKGYSLKRINIYHLFKKYKKSLD